MIKFQKLDLVLIRLNWFQLIIIKISKIRPGFDSVKLVPINNNQISKNRPRFDTQKVKERFCSALPLTHTSTLAELMQTTNRVALAKFVACCQY
jgi:hypothetical protein